MDHQTGVNGVRLSGFIRVNPQNSRNDPMLCRRVDCQDGSGWQAVMAAP